MTDQKKKALRLISDLQLLIADWDRPPTSTRIIRPAARPPAPRADVDEPSQLLSVDEVRTRLGVGRSTLFRLMREGDLPSIKIGKSRRIPAAAVADYIAALTFDEGAPHD